MTDLRNANLVEKIKNLQLRLVASQKKVVFIKGFEEESGRLSDARVVLSTFSEMGEREIENDKDVGEIVNSIEKYCIFIEELINKK